MNAHLPPPICFLPLRARDAFLRRYTRDAPVLGELATIMRGAGKTNAGLSMRRRRRGYV